MNLCEYCSLYVTCGKSGREVFKNECSDHVHITRQEMNSLKGNLKDANNQIINLRKKIANKVVKRGINSRKPRCKISSEIKLGDTVQYLKREEVSKAVSRVSGIVSKTGNPYTTSYGNGFMSYYEIPLRDIIGHFPK